MTDPYISFLCVFLWQLRGTQLNGQVLSLENCSREVAYLSLLYWDDPSALTFLPDMKGKWLYLPNGEGVKLHAGTGALVSEGPRSSSWHLQRKK